VTTPAALSATGTGKRPRVTARGRRNADAAPSLAALNPRALNFLAVSVPCRDKGREIILASGVQPGPAFWPLSLSLSWLSSLPLVNGGARTTRCSGKILLDWPISGEWNGRCDSAPRGLRRCLPRGAPYRQSSVLPAYALCSGHSLTADRPAFAGGARSIESLTLGYGSEVRSCTARG
jgi:hypothetical protein